MNQLKRQLRNWQKLEHKLERFTSNPYVGRELRRIWKREAKLRRQLKKSGGWKAEIFAYMAEIFANVLHR